MDKYYLGLGGQLADEELKRNGYQALFLLNLVKVIPDTMDEIHNLYQSFEKTCISLGEKTNQLLDVSSLGEEAVEAFKNELRAWAKKRYINKRWVIETIFLTFIGWFENEHEKYRLIFLNPEVGKARKLATKVQAEGDFSLPVYNPITMTELEYRKRTEKIISEYINETKIKFKEKGYISADEKRTTQHFYWFICFHILGKSVDDIALEFSDDDNLNGGINVDNIRKEIRKIYKYTGIDRKKRNKRKK